MIHKQKNCNIHNQDGAALIIALAMLALLLIMLIGFLSSNLLEQKIAYSYTDAVGSRLLARGVLQRVKTQLETADDLMWFRNRSEDVKLFAPIVSIADGDNGKLEPKKESDLDADSAYLSLKPLLYKYFCSDSSKSLSDWHWDNFFPNDKKADYPQWIYYYNNPEKDIITGRMAYVVIPNYGIDPSLLGAGEKEDVNININGSEYDELLLRSFVKSGKTGNIHKYNNKNLLNWLSLDVMLSKKGIGTEKNNMFDFSKVKEDFYSDEIGYKEFAELYFTTAQKIAKEQDIDSNARTNINLDGYNTNPTHAKWKEFLEEVNFEPAGVRDQVAANIVDYLDSGDVPTSDPEVPVAQWLSSTSHPKYTGNERTPYINQIAVGVSVTANHRITNLGVGNLSLGKLRTITVTPTARVYVELINMFNKKLSAGSIRIKGLTVTVKLTQTNEDDTTEVKTVTVSPTGNTITIPQTGAVGEINANSYYKNSVAVIDIGNILPTTFTKTFGRNATVTPVKLTAEVTNVSFDKVVLSTTANGTDFVDYVSEISDKDPFSISASISIDPDSNEEVVGNEYWEFEADNSEKTGSGYFSWGVDDPRCNLKAEQWALVRKRESDGLSESAIPDFGSQNNKSHPQNKPSDLDALAKGQDLEVADDPANVSTAFIRNGKMLSPWELGFIHRGEPWKTINLLQALDPITRKADSEKATYNNDAVILDKISFGPDEKTTADKYNINYPPSKPSAFIPLTYNLKGHNTDDGMLNNNGTMKASDLLSEDAAKDLYEWIANKCYDADDNAYHRYIHRGMLANVITAWARYGDKSPYKDASGIYIEELIGRLVPLTRCGENFEYFTVFAVAQSIKDVKGTIYIYKGDGTIDETNTKTDCEHGNKVEFVKDGNDVIYYDKITSETFFVARLRRQLTSCVKDDDCKRGIHKPECKFKVEVIDSYTINEL